MRTLEALARRLKPARRGGRPLPVLWLFTDPVRLPDPLGAAARLPRGAGVVARGLSPAVLVRLARLARRRGLALQVAGDGRAALRLRAGLHLPDRRPMAGAGLAAFLRARRLSRGGPAWTRLTMAAHAGVGPARRVRRWRPDLVFLSPVFPTASHPGAPSLGPCRWASMARRLPVPAAALGGIGPENAARLPRRVAHGVAAITALTEAVARTPHCLR